MQRLRRIGQIFALWQSFFLTNTLYFYVNDTVFI